MNVSLLTRRSPGTLSVSTYQSYHLAQHDQADCGPACLGMWLKFHGGEAPRARLRELSGTHKGGSSLLGLYQAATQLGLQAEGYEADVQSLKSCEHPAILHLITEAKLQHFVVCWGYDEAAQGFLIGDPASGTRFWSEAAVAAQWQSRSLLLCEGRTEAFQAGAARQQARKRWLLDLLQDDWPLLITSLFLGVLIALLGLSTSIFSQQLIDHLLPSKDVGRVLLALGLFAFLLLAQQGLGYLRSHFLLRQSRDFNVRVVSHFVASLLRLPKAFFDGRETGDLMARLNDTSRIQRTLAYLVSEVMIEALMLLVAAVAMMAYAWPIALACLLCLPLLYGLARRYQRPIQQGQQAVMQARGHTKQHYLSSMQGITPIKSFQREAHFTRLTQAVYGRLQAEGFSLGQIGLKFQLSSQLVATAFVLGVMGWGAWRVLHGQLSVGGLMALMQLSGLLTGAATRLALTQLRIQEAKVAFDRLFEFSSLAPEQMERPDALPLETVGRIQVKDLSFRFTGRPRLLEGVNLEVQQGDILALLGPSGSGKSTLLQLLQGFYAPEAGQILLNGHPLSAYALRDWRSKVGYLPQQVPLFPGNVIDNLLLGEEVEDPAALQAFFTDYGFDRYVQSFPQGYATLLGESGVALSGGQRQLVGLMRALYPRPQLLLLDEPTSAMDTQLREFVWELLERLRPQQAVVLCTHEAGLAERADHRVSFPG